MVSLRHSLCFALLCEIGYYPSWIEIFKEKQITFPWRLLSVHSDQKSVQNNMKMMEILLIILLLRCNLLDKLLIKYNSLITLLSSRLYFKHTHGGCTKNSSNFIKIHIKVGRDFQLFKHCRTNVQTNKQPQIQTKTLILFQFGP